MLGIIVPIIVTYFVYKNANENGRNGLLWAIINFVVTFGIQIAVGFAYALVALLVLGWTEAEIDGWALPVNLIGVALSLLAAYLIYRHVTRVPDSMFREMPPPPPRFN